MTYRACFMVPTNWQWVDGVPYHQCFNDNSVLVPIYKMYHTTEFCYDAIDELRRSGFRDADG